MIEYLIFLSMNWLKIGSDIKNIIHCNAEVAIEKASKWCLASAMT